MNSRGARRLASRVIRFGLENSGIRKLNPSIHRELLAWRTVSEDPDSQG